MTKLEKILNNLDADTITEMEASSVDTLKATIVGAEQAIASTKQKLEDNQAYEEAKENIKALSHGFREVKKRQTAKIQLALILLEQRGQ